MNPFVLLALLGGGVLLLSQAGKQRTFWEVKFDIGGLRIGNRRFRTRDEAEAWVQMAERRLVENDGALNVISISEIPAQGVAPGGTRITLKDGSII
jgi:hypothetical protein